jgi:hypothetical protein
MTEELSACDKPWVTERYPGAVELRTTKELSGAYHPWSTEMYPGAFESEVDGLAAALRPRFHINSCP